MFHGKISTGLLPCQVKHSLLHGWTLVLTQDVPSHSATHDRTHDLCTIRFAIQQGCTSPQITPQDKAWKCGEPPGRSTAGPWANEFRGLGSQLTNYQVSPILHHIIVMI